MGSPFQAAAPGETFMDEAATATSTGHSALMLAYTNLGKSMSTSALQVFLAWQASR